MSKEEEANISFMEVKKITDLKRHQNLANNELIGNMEIVRILLGNECHILSLLFRSVH